MSEWIRYSPLSWDSCCFGGSSSRQVFRYTGFVAPLFPEALLFLQIVVVCWQPRCELCSATNSHSSSMTSSVENCWIISSTTSLRAALYWRSPPLGNSLLFFWTNLVRQRWTWADSLAAVFIVVVPGFSWQHCTSVCLRWSSMRLSSLSTVLTMFVIFTGLIAPALLPTSPILESLFSV